MKFMLKLSALIFCTFLFITACQEKDSDIRSAARESLDVPSTSNNTAITPTPITTGSVSHYICPNNCEGSGSNEVGVCPVCGTDYVHNQAWHDAQAATANTTAANTTTQATAQNASGVYHYICSNGCSGGSATAGSCPTCGAELSHNQAYHNTPAEGGQLPVINNAAVTAQNAAGIYHYICSNGCAGGAGAAGNCPTCGAALSHNQAYHQ